MRNVLILVFLCCSLTISGTIYYVSPSGSDSNPGTIGQPFFTLSKAWTIVSAGDIVYMRGGTYRYTSGTTLTGKSGSSGNLISILAYPGEKPIIDYTGQIFTSSVQGIRIENVDYLYMKGIRITGISQPTAGNCAMYGLILWTNVTNSTFEQMETDHIGGWGVVTSAYCSNIIYLNCDSHHNADPYSADAWGWSDGFNSPFSSTNNNITYNGCRAWWNSDDGFDSRGCNGLYTYINCWSFWNGHVPGTFTNAGDGEGFKLGGNMVANTSEIRRVVENCLAFGNKLSAFDGSEDDYHHGYRLYNNIGYGNTEGFNFNYTNPSILRNNISYNNTNSIFRDGSSCTHDHNSWDIPIAVTDADFLSVNSAGMDGPRQSDGSLPVLNFLKLAPGSKLAGAGVDVGIPYKGNAPDLGAFQAGTGSTITLPVYTSSAVQSATPSVLEMTYNMTLANIVPSLSTFTVLVNSVAGIVSSITVSGTKVKLTLANPIVAGDIVTVSYTKPAANPIQTTSNGIAASISNQQVINNCINTPPTVIITSPLNNSTFSVSSNMTITASALDTDGSVTLVEFYNGTTKLGSKSSAPYTFTWNNMTAGNYSLTATVTDNLNAKSTSASVSISVVNNIPVPNQHPIVKIVNPSKGNKFDQLSPVIIDAIASDPDGLVSKVEIYNGSVKLVELTSAPYTYTWKNVVAGKYRITAIATDNLNDTTVSSPVEFEVGLIAKYDVNSEIVKLYPNPNNGHFSIEFINPMQSDKSEIIITDLAGKQVYNGRVLKEETLKQIDLSDSRSGIYVMMIKEKEILVTKKFIKN